MVGKYNFVLAGEESINGRHTFVLTFTPRSKRLPVRRRPDRLLNKLAGKIWIDTRDYNILRIQGHLIEKAAVGWGMLGALRGFELRFEQTEVDENVWLPRRFDLSFEARILFGSVRRRLTGEFSNFKKGAGVVAARVPSQQSITPHSTHPALQQEGSR